MAPRANWKGFLKLAELSCPVALYTAASTNERIAFHTINRETGHRVHRQYVDAETGEAVPTEDQVKGYEIAQNQYVMLAPEEVSAVVPESDKTLTIESFIDCAEIDDVYFDRPYYLAPSDPLAEEGFAVLRDAMREKKVAALARAVLFRRVRSLLIVADGQGLFATTLNFDYEIRSAEEAFADIPESKIAGEMLDLAKHIIATKQGHFDPRLFKDRYEEALAGLIRAKLEGKEIAPRKAAPEAKVIDLMQALRESAGIRAPTRAAKSARVKKPAAKSAAKVRSTPTRSVAATRRKKA